MSEEGDVDVLKTNRICHECVGEACLKAEIKASGEIQKCSYCDVITQSFTMLEMSDRVDVAFEQHFTLTSTDPDSWEQTLLSDRESTYEWDRHGEQVVWAIANAADIDESPSEDLQKILDERYGNEEAARTGEETQFSSDTHYEEKDVSKYELQSAWDSFERSLKTESRFFNGPGAAFLAEIFGAIDKMSSVAGRPLVLDIGPGTAITELYRARAFQSEDKLKLAMCYPDKELGSPPMLAATAGRMNARGISVFYASTDPAAAIAEVRPPVGSTVAVGRFGIVRAIRLLDLTALGEAAERGSIFDSSFLRRLERAAFLRSLSTRITQPVMPNHETFEYLATQAVADFLATENNPLLDGIAFPSVQAAGNALNVVLFHKAAKVEPIVLPIGSTVEASTGEFRDEGWEDDYSVVEELPPPAPAPPPPTIHGLADLGAPLADGSWARGDHDARTSTLRVDTNSVVVHVIDSVRFTYTSHDVHRRRWERRALKGQAHAPADVDDF